MSTAKPIQGQSMKRWLIEGFAVAMILLEACGKLVRCFMGPTRSTQRSWTSCQTRATAARAVVVAEVKRRLGVPRATNRRSLQLLGLRSRLTWGWADASQSQRTRRPATWLRAALKLISRAISAVFAIARSGVRPATQRLLAFAECEADSAGCRNPPTA